MVGRLVRTGLVGLSLLLLCAWFLRHLLARLPARDLALMLALFAGAALVGGAIVAAAAFDPAAGTGDAALVRALQSLGQGDLTQEFIPSPSNATSGQARVGAALHGAQGALKAIVGELRSSTREAVTRAQDLSSQAGALASTSQRALEGSAAAAAQGTELRQAAVLALDESARAATSTAVLTGLLREGEGREGRMRDATREGVRLLTSEGDALDALAVRLRESAREIESLSAASEEIRGFVTLVRKMARQSKLLALNASMEAARAGEQGSGFAVVAGEVRRLAKSSNEAADRTDALVNDLLARIARVRVSSEDAVEHVLSVRGSADESVHQLRALDEAVGEERAPSYQAGDALSTRGQMDAIAARVEALSHMLGAHSATLAEHASQVASQHGRVLDLSAATGALTRQTGRAAAAANAFRTDAAALSPTGGGADPPPRSEASTPATPAPARLLTV